MKGAGCEKCNNTGYKGRVGLYEVMEVTDELRELVLVGASALELRRKAIEEGMITLRQSGLRKVSDGMTTIEEVAQGDGEVDLWVQASAPASVSCSREMAAATELGF